MHPATILLLVFFVSCVAINFGPLVPIFASDGGQFGERQNLEMLLGSTSVFSDGKPATGHGEPAASSGASTAGIRTAACARTHLGDSDEVFFCDRSDYRGDVCYLRGDLRMHGELPSIVLHTRPNSTLAGELESIQPLARKWENNTMRTVENISISSLPASALREKCDVWHSKPAIVFSTGGFSGNVYHDFNDILIPLFITSQHYKGEVVLVVTEYRAWWWSKYARLLRQLSRYRMIDLQADFRTHCYPEAIVGLLIHGELMVDPARMPNGETIHDFQKMLARAYDVSRLVSKLDDSQQQELGRSPVREGSTPDGDPVNSRKPLLVLILRRGNRLLLNQEEVTSLARGLGFEVKKLTPSWPMSLRKVYQIVHSADVVMGVHGAGLTHLLFMSPRSIFIQIVPIGVHVPAAQYYGEPAVRCGLHYLQYDIVPEESSLLNKFPRNHPALTDPKAIAARGWDTVKETYLDNQDVQPNLRELRKLLGEARCRISGCP